MNIDWVTTIAMIVNFLVLVFLLRRFLYGPIMKVMDEREQKIVQREEEAAEKARQAVAEAGRFREKELALREQEEAIMEQARLEADAERRSLADQARREMGEVQKRWQEAFFRQKESFVLELRRQMGKQACRIAEKCLRDLADARLEEMVFIVFMDKIDKLGAEESARLHTLLEQGEGKISVRSAFELSGEKLDRLRERLSGLIPGELHLAYETAPGLICGLELEASGYRIAWTVESYLEGLEEQIMRTLDLAREAVEDDRG